MLQEAMIAAVIFDLYGTLLQLRHDSRPFNQLARRNPTTNLRSALETALTTTNPTLADFASRLGIPPQDDLPSLDAALSFDIGDVQPFADARSTLCAIKKHGILTAVISNLATPYKKPFTDHNLNELTDVTVFSCDCGLLKPNPQIYQLALEQLGTAASDTIMVGDSFKSDVDGPSKIGIMGIHLVRSGDSSRANTVIQSLDEVVEHAT